MTLLFGRMLFGSSRAHMSLDKSCIQHKWCSCNIDASLQTEEFKSTTYGSLWESKDSEINLEPNPSHKLNSLIFIHS